MNSKQIEVLKTKSLTAAQKLVLMAMIEFKGESQSSIAKSIHMSACYFSQVCSSLEKSGFIKRHKEKSWQQAEIEILI